MTAKAEERLIVRYARDFGVNPGGTHLAVAEYAAVAEADGPPILLLHGLLTSGEAWRSVIPFLPASRRIVVPDLRGHGRSASALHDVELEELVDDLFGVLEALAVPRAMLVGLSLGGLVCVRAAARRPERVAGLALVATPALPETMESRQRRLGTLEAMGRLGGRRVLRGMAGWLFGVSTRRHSPEVVEAWLDGMEEADPIGIRRTAQAALGRPDLRPWLGHVRVPALVVVGAEDGLVSAEDVSALAGHLPGATVSEVPGAGHLVPLERPGALGAVLARWIASADGAASLHTGDRNGRTVA